MEEKKIGKGLDLACRDLKVGMVDLINGSGLPPTLVNYVLGDLMNETRYLMQQAIEQEEKDFEEMTKETLEEKNKSKGEKKNGE